MDKLRRVWFLVSVVAVIVGVFYISFDNTSAAEQSGGDYQNSLDLMTTQMDLIQNEFLQDHYLRVGVNEQVPTYAFF